MPNTAGHEWRQSSCFACSPSAEFDRNVPAVILKIGQYPITSGALAATRTLGRVGVPVFALVERGITPVGASRYCAATIAWRTSARDDIRAVASRLCTVGRGLGTKSLLVPLDDESAVLVAEEAACLAEYFLFPQVAATLPRQVASKAGLRELCQQFDVATPASAAPISAAELADFASRATFPLVVKNAGVWDTRNATRARLGWSSSGPRLVHDLDELLDLEIWDDDGPALLVQEYIPGECAEDWIVNLYADADGDCRPVFTGRKVRGWPPVAGVVARGISARNSILADASARFCKTIGYCGVADMDWRFDRRDGQYKLLDFNPRLGNSFRMFVTEQQIDVLQALHLDLTGRAIPHGPQVDNRRLVLEHIDLPARLINRLGRYDTVSTVGQPAGQCEPVSETDASTEYAWFAADDPLPLLAMLSRVISLFKIIHHGLQARRLNTRPETANRPIGRARTTADRDPEVSEVPVGISPPPDQARVT
jgi:D-aspartate ligase